MKQTVAPCRYEVAQKGSCRRGVSCYFDHDFDHEGELQPPRSLDTTTNDLANVKFKDDRRPLIPCTFFKRGACSKGGSCAFSHDVSHQRHEEYASEPLKNTNFVESVIDGVSVTFGAGAKVEKIILPQQFSSVSLSGLPSNTTLSQSGFLSLLRPYADPAITTVKLSRTNNGATALVTVEDPCFAETICQGLTAELTQVLGCPGLIVTKVPTAFTAGWSKQRVTRAVLCSWAKPTVQVTLFYLDEIAARTALELFKAETGGFTFRGKTIRTAVSRIHENYTTEWRVKLYRVPACTSSVEIRSIFTATTQPYSIEMSAPSYLAEDDISNKVKKALGQIGPLADFITHTTTGTMQKATANFVQDSHATKALCLDRTSLNADVKLSIQLQVKTKIRVLTSLFDTVQGLDEIKNDHSSVEVHVFRNNDAAHRLTTIMLTSCNECELSKAKRALDKLFEERQTCKIKSGKVLNYVLNKHSFPVLMRNINQVREQLPNCTIKVDLGEPRKLIISGIDAELKSANTLLGELLDLTVMDCCICWTPAEDSLQLSCSHTYCSDCFENMCSAATRGDEDTISCQGDAGSCKRCIPLNELKQKLSYDQYQTILQSSLDSYVRHRSDQYRHCPTKDCGQLYMSQISMKTSSTKTEVCLRCLNTICLDCHACHGRMSCQDWKYAQDGGEAAFEHAKQRLGVKDCPNCKTPIEKESGCNHMTCSGCGIHICWVCLRTFRESEATYQHMRDAHGGIGLDDVVAEEDTDDEDSDNDDDWEDEEEIHFDYYDDFQDEEEDWDSDNSDPPY